MIVCSNCHHAVPTGLTSCVSCGADVDPDDDSTVDNDAEVAPKWSIIRTFSTEIEARIVAGRLIAHGVPACVLSQVDTTRNFTVGALALAKVFVPDAMRPEAEDILAMPGLDENFVEGEDDDGPSNN
ncbi:MAG: hypothetical protein H7X80_03975 [bacterium]|nr:hypothetical protein [Candidatus Kapabacteria bacterium]